MTRRMSESGARVFAAAVVGGFVAGFALWSREQHARRRDLFSRRPLQRLAALGYLAGRRDADTARVLREYVRWEPRADLRNRATRLLVRTERDLV